MNTLINSINGLKSNKWFSYADWDNQPVTVVAEKIIESVTSDSVTEQLNNLDLVCANTSTTCQTSFDSKSCSTTSCTTTTNTTTSNSISNSIQSNTGFGTEFQSQGGNGNNWSDRNFCSAGTPSNGVNSRNNVGNTTDSHRTSFSQTTTNSTTSNSTNSTNSTFSNQSVNSTYYYNFSVVTGKPIVTNSKTSE